MRKLIGLLVGALLWAAPASAQLSMMGVGAGGPSGGANLTALDGSGQGAQTSSGTTCTASFTTAQTNDLVFAYVTANSASNISAGATFSDGGGLTWTSDATVSGAAGQADTLGHAVKAASGAITVTATLPATVTFCTLIAFGVSGANTASPFDGSVVSGAAPLSITTTNANDFIIAGFGQSSVGSPVAGACCTLIIGAQFQGAEYDKVTTTQSGLSIGTGNNADVRAIIARAIKSN